MDDRAGSDSKNIGGEKRAFYEFQHKDQLFRKRASVHSDFPLNDGRSSSSCQVEERVADSYSCRRQPETAERDTSPVEVNPLVQPRSLDLNVQITSPTNFPNHDKKAEEPTTNCVNSAPTGLDLNAKVVSGSTNYNPFHSNRKGMAFSNTEDASECGSSCGSPPKENECLRVWNEMKQNGFLSSFNGGLSSVKNSLVSSSHGGIPPVPKKRGRKSKNDLLNENIELAKREQADRFAKIAAPSGLLNSLNPGIINHVRNRKQVHSIIESLVKSEKLERSQIATNHSNHINRKNHQVVDGSQANHPRALSWDKQFRGCTIPKLKSCYSVPYGKCEDGGPTMIDQVIQEKLALRLSSSAKASDNAKTSFLYEEDSADLSSASSLSLKAATVASQWLELLQQDIKGRLSALQRSKKRVQDVLETELLFLISKEFSSNQENDPSILQISADRISLNATADMHRTKWSALFDQMCKALSEEEKQLEGWAYQVKEIQLHCDHGLNHIQGSRLGKGDVSEKELAVGAAAASIYSTYNFLLTKDNASCF